jgi:hypothetical protein
MEKTGNTGDDCKVFLGDVKPEVKAFDYLVQDLFTRISSDVGVGLEQRLA